MRINYDVVDEDMSFDGYRLLLLPDDIRITEKLKAKLEAFPGAIISTGKSIAEGSIWDYITDLAPDTNTHGFYRWGDETYGQKYVGVKMKSEYSVSDYIEPYFNKHWDGYHGYFYVPPKATIGCSAVAKKGNRAHICFRLFTAYMEFGAQFHRELVESLINEFMPDRLVESADLPSSSRVTLRVADDFDVLQVKVSVPEHWANRGVINEHTVLPAGRMEETADMLCTVAGCCCESGDLIQEDVLLPELQRGDLLAVLTTGAYNYSMASNYNRVPRPPIVMLGKNGPYVAVRRETLDDLLDYDQ
jgi:hypothetical protein